MFEDPKTIRTILKITLAGVSMLAYGAIHRSDKKLQQKIDEWYPDAVTTSEDQELPTAK
jgi:hypothetical protein